MHSLHNNFDREGPGGANVYILCLEEFTSVEMLSSDGSSSQTVMMAPVIHVPQFSVVPIRPV
jgi:hypothetical protein